MALPPLKSSRELPAIDLDKATHYAVANVKIVGQIPNDEVVHIISADNPVLKQSSQSLVGVARLCEYLDNGSYRWLRAIGSDFFGCWPAEESCAVIGISDRQALKIASDFGQEAVFRASTQAQDVLFVKGGEISVPVEVMSERRVRMQEPLSDFLERTLGISTAPTGELLEPRGWWLCGDPMSFGAAGEPTHLRIVRSLDNGTSLGKPLVAIVDTESGAVDKITPPRKRVESETLRALVGSRIHLDRCAWSDEVRSMVANRYRIYVWAPHLPYPDAPTGKMSLYVGVTGKSAEERIAQHRGDPPVKSARWVRKHDGQLEPSLMPEVRLPTSPTAKAFEEWWANLLRYRGYFVKGGH